MQLKPIQKSCDFILVLFGDVKQPNQEEEIIAVSEFGYFS